MKFYNLQMVKIRQRKLSVWSGVRSVARAYLRNGLLQKYNKIWSDATI